MKSHPVLGHLASIVLVYQVFLLGYTNPPPAVPGAVLPSWRSNHSPVKDSLQKATKSNYIASLSVSSVIQGLQSIIWPSIPLISFLLIYLIIREFLLQTRPYSAAHATHTAFWTTLMYEKCC